VERGFDGLWGAFQNEELGLFPVGLEAFGQLQAESAAPRFTHEVVRPVRLNPAHALKEDQGQTKMMACIFSIPISDVGTASILCTLAEIEIARWNF
jgi:hypothetical protein